MASHSRYPNPIYFFKIIPKSNLETLRIPNKFTVKYGDCLPNPVFLKPPDGKEWEVHWTKDHDNGFWFQKGWNEFSGFYSLDFGHLVLFRYEGTSQLDVHIFDQSSLEIDYPFHDSFPVQNHSLNDKISDENVVEILDDDMPLNQKVRPKTTVPSPQPQKKMRTVTRQDVENRSSNLQNLHVFQNSTISELENCKHESEEDMEGEAFTENKGLNFECMKSITAGEKIEALKRASTFRSGNPFFKVVMQPTYVSGKCRMFLPVKFAKTYLNVKSNAGTGSIKLLVEDGVWSVGYVSRRSGKKLLVQFSSGWRQFCKDNDLKVGDVCVFELIQRIRLKLQVTIFRAAKHVVHSNDENVVEILDDEMPSNQKVRPKTIVPSPRPRKKMKTTTCQDVENKSSNLQNLHAFQKSTNSENCKHESEEDVEGEAFTENKGLNFECMKSITAREKIEALERASTFRSENPFFKVVMQPSYVSGNMFLPVKFVKTYLNVKSNARTGSVKLLVEDGVWSVGYLSRRSGKKLSVQFSCGWRQFYNDNDLKVGDVCVFELIQRIRLELQVTIFRATKHIVHSNDENVVGILDDEMPSNQMVRPKTIVPSPRPHKKMKKTSTCKDVENKSSNLQNLHAFQKSTNSENCKQESEEDMEGEALTKNKCLNFESPKSLTAAEKMEALKRASMFRSENPFFTVVVQPSYVTGRFHLHVPRVFITRHLKSKENVMIENGNRSWHMKILPYYGKSTQFRFSGGWRSFARKRKLQVGDICIFELIQKGNEVLQVHIFRSLN